VADQRIEAHLITKPIQLLAAWLIGLVLTVSAFFAAARLITTPDWVPGLLSVAAVLCVPGFLLCIFLLQTKFRPEMQEDSCYSAYLLQQRQAMVKQKEREAGLEAEIRTVESKLAEAGGQASDKGEPAILGTRANTERDQLMNRLSHLESQLHQVRKLQENLASPDGLLSPVAYFREINLVDSSNKVRAVLTSLVCDEPALMFFGKEGYQPGNEAKHTVLLESCNEGDARLYMRSSQLNNSAEIDVDERGHASFSLNDAGKRANMGMFIHDGEANLAIDSQQHQTNIILRARADGSTWVTVIRDGKVVWTAG
jgi:hypothetical protein